MNTLTKMPADWKAQFYKERLEATYNLSQLAAWFILLVVAGIAWYLAISKPNFDPRFFPFMFSVLACQGVISILTLIGGNHPPKEKWISRSNYYRLIVTFYSITTLINLNITFVISWLRVGLNANYIIGVIFYCLFFYNPTRLYVLLVTLNWFFYIYCVTLGGREGLVQTAANISGTIATAGALFVGHVFFNNHAKQYYYKRTIEKQTAELAQANQELYQLMTTDSLTQVPNRRYFDEYVQKQWQIHHQDQKYLGVLLCDVDYFKLYNDTYGHQAGDECLIRVAQAIKHSLRERDVVARYGGEEFVVTLDEVSYLESQIIGDRICNQVRELAIPHRKSPKGIVTISVGIICAVPSQELPISRFIAFADRALYECKSRGRDRAIVHS